MEAARSSETLINFAISHGVTSQNIVLFIVTVVGTSNTNEFDVDNLASVYVSHSLL
jgi:hypothetical protein